MLLPLYDLEPFVAHSWIAPNATIIGEVLLEENTHIWHNVVIRGDINIVK
jgi:carbonic anhydrase/acetyltransferase-like protein (isoleucine patch superfamily)